MTFRRTVLLSALPVLLLAGGTFAVAQSNSDSFRVAQQPIEAEEEGPRHGRRHGGDRWLEQLDLSAEQSEQIQTIKEQARANSEGLHQQMEQEKEELRSLLASDATADQLRQQHQQVQTLKMQLGDRRFETMLAVREVLTPEQRTELAELAEARGERRGGSR